MKKKKDQIENESYLVMGNAKYSHDALIDLIIENPGWSHAQYSAHFGYAPAWLSQIIALDVFQMALDPRRHEINDPSIVATMEERLRSISLLSMNRLSDIMHNDSCEQITLVKAMENANKALGMGNAAFKHLAPERPPAPSNIADRANSLVERMNATGEGRLADRAGKVQDVEVVEKWSK